MVPRILDRPEYGGGWVGISRNLSAAERAEARERNTPIARFATTVTWPDTTQPGSVWLDDELDRDWLIATLNRRAEVMRSRWPETIRTSDTDLHVLALLAMLEVLAFRSRRRGMAPDAVTASLRTELPPRFVPMWVSGTVDRDGKAGASFEPEPPAPFPIEDNDYLRPVADLAWADVIWQVRDLSPSWDPFAPGA